MAKIMVDFSPPVKQLPSGEALRCNAEVLSGAWLECNNDAVDWLFGGTPPAARSVAITARWVCLYFT